MHTWNLPQPLTTTRGSALKQTFDDVVTQSGPNARWSGYCDFLVTGLHSGLKQKGHKMQLQIIGSYETKTHLADVLRRVREGQGFTITQRGEPVADLLPAGISVRRAGSQAAVGMRRLMLEAAPLDAFDIKSMIESGRD